MSLIRNEIVIQSVLGVERERISRKESFAGDEARSDGSRGQKTGRICRYKSEKQTGWSEVERESQEGDGMIALAMGGGGFSINRVALCRKISD